MAKAALRAEEVIRQPKGQALPCSKMAVPAGEGGSTYYAVDWALDNVVADKESIYLLHVQPPVHSIPVMGWVEQVQPLETIIRIAHSSANEESGSMPRPKEAGTSETKNSDVHNVKTLEQQLSWVQKDAEIQAKRCQKAMKLAEEYDAYRNEATIKHNNALRDAHIAKQQTWTQAKKCADLQISLEAAKDVVEATLWERDAWKQKALDMAKKHHKMQTSCEDAMQEAETWRQAAVNEIKKHEQTKSALHASIEVAEAAKQQWKAAEKKWEEALAEIEEMNIMLDLEIKLRRETQEKATREVLAKQEALAALQRAQRRYREYTYEELQVATFNFDERNKLSEGRYRPVYKGKIHQTIVAIKCLAQSGMQGDKEFDREVALLSQIHHPHIVMLLGASPESGCIVYEYMANGSLDDRLKCKNNTPPLPWYVRFRICFEVATALVFLHSLPVPIVHHDVNIRNILLDHNFVSKIRNVGVARFVPNNLTCTGATQYSETMPAGTLLCMDPSYQHTDIIMGESNVRGLGIIMLQLLTGRPAAGITELVEKALENGGLKGILDESAGEWPFGESLQLAYLSLRCADRSQKECPSLETFLLEAMENLRRVADVAAANAAGPSHLSGECVIPSLFFCPIGQEIMKDPHVAADGFTYEAEAIKTWLAGHTTSPMTNLQLGHLNLVPNLSLKSAIRDWQDKIHMPCHTHITRESTKFQL